jgi:hypothetical protein
VLRCDTEWQLYHSASAPQSTDSRRLTDRSLTLAQRYIEKGLRVDEHPLIRFADGPSGPRARLVGGPDVWEVIAVARDNNGNLPETAAYLELPLDLVQTAASYYAICSQEIDERIERNRLAAHDAYSAFVVAAAHPGDDGLANGEDWL